MKILVTGGTGMVGHAIKKYIASRPASDLSEVSGDGDEYIFLGSNDCDLTNLDKTILLFNRVKPDYVIHLAAHVGGLYKNMNNKVDMLEKNLMINFNVIKCCHDFKVKKCISCLSTCIFPDKISYPINETMLHQGAPHCSNNAYAYAKRMLEIHSKAYRDNYKDNFMCIIPTNIYGDNDNYDLEDGHVIPALIHRCYISKQNNKKFMVRGSGKPLRQFIYADDLAKLILWVLSVPKNIENIILSPSNEISIEDVARKIAKKFNYESHIQFDPTYSDGQYKKTADNSLLMSLYGDFKFTSIDLGLSQSINWFIEHREAE